jgi:hypothetical protein
LRDYFCRLVLPRAVVRCPGVLENIAWVALHVSVLLNNNTTKSCNKSTTKTCNLAFVEFQQVLLGLKRYNFWQLFREITMDKKTIECKQCGGDMYYSTKKESNFGVQVLGVIVFLIGLGLLLAIMYFPISTFVGLCLMVAAGRMGYKKLKGWKCSNCGYFFEAD